MFFNSLKTLAEKAISDVYTLSTGSHATSATIDAMRQKHEEAKEALEKIHDKAEEKRGKAWLLWVGTGIPNMFISIAWIGMPLTLVSMAAAVYTGCQYLKMRAANKNIEKLDEAVEPLIDDAQRQRRGVLAQQRQQEIDAKRALERENMKPVAGVKPAADGFNVAASDLDLDQDVTVRRIKLKPKDPAAAA